MTYKFKFKPNVFTGSIFFWIGPVEGQALQEWYCSHGPTDKNNFITEDAQHEYDGRCFYPDSWCPLIHVLSAPHTPEQIGVLIHEIHHAVNRYLSDIGVTPCWQSEETYAYLTGTLVEAVLDYVWHGNLQPGVIPG